MANKVVKFARRTREVYDAMASHDPDTLYFITDTHELFMGDEEYIPENVATLNDIAEALSEYDSLKYKGTLGDDGEFTTLPTENVKSGDVYAVVTPNIYAGKYCGIGDTVVAIKTVAEDAGDDAWVVIQYLSEEEIKDIASPVWEPNPIGTWDDIQNLVATGEIKEYFQVGDVLSTKIMYEGELRDYGWRIIGFDHDKVDLADESEHTMTLEATYSVYANDPEHNQPILHGPHKIASFLVSNHTLSDGKVIRYTDVVEYCGEVSELTPEVIATIIEGGHSKVYRYIGQQSVEYDDIIVSTDDIICASKAKPDKLAKVVSCTVVAPSGYSTITQNVVIDNIPYDQAREKTLVMCEDAIVDARARSFSALKLSAPLFAGCYMCNMHIFGPPENGVSDDLGQCVNLINPSIDILQIESDSELPDVDVALERVWYIDMSTTTPTWYHIKSEDGVHTWFNAGTHEILNGCPSASVGRLDYISGDIRKILNSNKADFLDGWTPDPQFNGFDVPPHNSHREGFVHMLTEAAKEDAYTQNFLGTLVSPTKLVVDVDELPYVAYVPALDRKMVGSNVKDGAYPPTQYIMQQAEFDYVIKSIEDLIEVAYAIDNGTLAELLDCSPEFAEFALSHGLVVLHKGDLELPNGEATEAYIEGEDGLYGMLVWIDEGDVPTIDKFHAVLDANAYGENPKCVLTGTSEFQDMFFVSALGEVKGNSSLDEGEPYEFYQRSISEFTDDANTERVKDKLVDQSHMLGSYTLRTPRAALIETAGPNSIAGVGAVGQITCCLYNEPVGIVPLCVIGR